LNSGSIPSKDALPVIILFGPTASGKTSLLEDLFARKRLYPAEIISADSMQVYRGMDIGTAKPTPEERARIPHRLIDIRNPDEQFNAGEFVTLASEACLAAAARGSLPVVSGGTGFYLKNLVLGLPETPPSNPAIRTALQKEMAGREALMEELSACDPVSAGRIHPNDTYRLLRALEVFRASGRPLSSFAQSGQRGPAGAFRFLILGLMREREELYRRINERCAAMFRAGLGAELEGLFAAGYTPLDPGLKAIGYKEFFVESMEEGGREGEITRWRLSRDLAGVQALVAGNSRRYAKRQITFFASIPGIKWIEAGASPAEAAAREIEAFLNH
jgi:tRNA dimethylallyltransferase